MVRAEIKQAAKDNLRGKWTKPVLFTLLYMVITYILNLVLSLIPIVGSIALLVIDVPIAYIFMTSFIKMKRGEEVGYFDVLTKIPDNFAAAWKVVGRSSYKNVAVYSINCCITYNNRYSNGCFYF